MRHLNLTFAGRVSNVKIYSWRLRLQEKEMRLSVAAERRSIKRTILPQQLPEMVPAIFNSIISYLWICFNTELQVSCNKSAHIWGPSRSKTNLQILTGNERPQTRANQRSSYLHASFIIIIVKSGTCAGVETRRLNRWHEISPVFPALKKVWSYFEAPRAGRQEAGGVWVRRSHTET